MLILYLQNILIMGGLAAVGRTTYSNRSRRGTKRVFQCIAKGVFLFLFQNQINDMECRLSLETTFDRHHSFLNSKTFSY